MKQQLLIFGDLITFKRVKVVGLLSIVFSLVSLVGMVLVKIDLMRWLLEVSLAVFVLSLICFHFLEQSRRLTLVDSVAKELHFERNHQLHSILEGSAIFQLGTSRKISNCYSGVYHNVSLHIFSSEFVIKKQKDVVGYYDFFSSCVNTLKSLPHAIIVANDYIEWMYKLPVGLKSVRTESNDFDKLYTVYISKNEINAFQLLDPDDMNHLIRYAHLSPIVESIDKKVLSLLSVLPTNKETLVNFIEFTCILSKKLSR